MSKLMGALTVCALLGSANVSYAAFSSIGSNFNGTSIAGTSDIWFNSHLTSVSGASGDVTIYFVNQTITFASGAVNYNLPVPDGAVTIHSGATASTSYSGGWQTTAGSSSGTPFLAGLAFDVPSGGIPGGVNPVTWSGDFYASQTGVSIQWQWAAAVYTTFSADYNALGVLPVDSGGRQSGTPVNYTTYVIGGARGGGGSNFTGSNSGTGKAKNLEVVPEPATFVAGALLLLPFGASALRMLRKNRTP